MNGSLTVNMIIIFFKAFMVLGLISHSLISSHAIVNFHVKIFLVPCGNPFISRHAKAISSDVLETFGINILTYRE